MSDRRWGSRWIVILLLLLSWIVRIFLTLHRQLNADEFQHLHASWMIHLGYLPYRDFWENHSPLLYFLTAPVLFLLGEGVHSVLVIRMLHSIVGVAITGIVYVLARIDYDRTTAMLAVLVLSFSEIFLQKTIEIRTDQFLVLFWLVSLWICFRRIDFPKDLRFWIAGLLLGIGMLFSPKAMICAAALSIALFFHETGQFNRMLKRQFFFFTGFLLPVSMMGLYFRQKQLFDSFLDSTIFQNLSYPDTRGPFFLLFPQNLGFLLLAFAGMVLSFRDRKSATGSRLTGIRALLISAWIPFAVLVFFMPSTFSQSALTFVPIFAIYAGFALHKSLLHSPPFKFRQILFLIFTFLTGLLLPVGALMVRVSSGDSNQQQMDLIRYMHTHTNRDENIFDGNAAYIFRRQAYYYGSLVEGLRYKIERGEITESIPESLKRNQCRVILYDDRVSDLPQQIQDFLRANYLPAGYQNVFIAGKELGAENLTGGRALFRIEIPQMYSIDARGGKNVKINGKPYRRRVLLGRGVHELVSEEPLKGVTIRADFKEPE